MMKFFIAISGYMLLLKRSMVLADCDPTNQVPGFCCPLSLGPVTIASTVSSIPNKAFEFCTTLTSIDLTNVTSLGTYVFNGYTNLASVTLGSGITTLPDSTFQGCSSLTSIDLTHVARLGTDGIGNCNVFNGCTSLATVTLGSALTTLPFLAFNGCSSLTSIDLTNVTSVGGLVFGGCTSLKSIIIPDTVKKLEKAVFRGCTSLTSVTIGTGLASLSGGLFQGCTALTSIIIPYTVTSLLPYVFLGCTKLTSITIPNSLANSISTGTIFDNSGFAGLESSFNTCPYLANDAPVTYTSSGTVTPACSAPTAIPTADPTLEPTAIPTATPTSEPTAIPTTTPTSEPTAIPTADPTATPTAIPTAAHTAAPTTRKYLHKKPHCGEHGHKQDPDDGDWASGAQTALSLRGGGRVMQD